MLDAPAAAVTWRRSPAVRAGRFRHCACRPPQYGLVSPGPSWLASAADSRARSSRRACRSGGSAGRCVAEEALDVGMRLLRRSSRSRPCTRSAKWFWAWEPPWLDRQADIAVGGSPSALAIGEDCCLFTQDFLVVGPAEGRARLDLCRSTRRTGHLQPRRASYTTSQDAALLMPSFTYAGARSG